RNLVGQMGFFDGPQKTVDATLPAAEDFSEQEKLTMEKEITGMYLSGHPMAQYKAFYENETVGRIDQILESGIGESDRYKDEDRVDLLVIISALKKKLTKNDQTLAFATAEDMYGSIEVIVFPVVYERFKEEIALGKIIKLHGRISFTEEKDPKLICDYAVFPEEDSALQKKPAAPPAANAHKGLYLKITDRGLYEKALKIVAVFDGTTDLYVYFADTKKLVKAPSVYRVQVNDVLLRELKKILGEENVAIKG
ncbi:MAG: DNA polymerase III subunit alpha, partial [Oscillospiraceae bacterium]